MRALIGNATLERVSTWADDAKHHINQNDAEMLALLTPIPTANPRNHTDKLSRGVRPESILESLTTASKHVKRYR